MNLRMVPANGVPVSVADLVNVLCRLPGTGAGRFTDAVSAWSGLPHCFGTWSGRSALYLLLLSLKKQRPGKHEVLIPVLTCESVYYSVIRAGLTPVLYDIDPETLGSHPDRIRERMSDGTLAVIVSSLFGITVDMDAVMALRKQGDFYFIEDAAQAMGARWNGRLLGTFGDACIFSFGKSKNITTIHGGMIGTPSPEIAASVGTDLAGWSSPGIMDTLKLEALLAINSIVIRPFFFNLLVKSGIRFADLHFDAGFPLRKMGPLQERCGAVMLEKLDELNSVRRKNAIRIMEMIVRHGGIRLLPGCLKNQDDSVYLRLPVVAEDEKSKSGLIRRLNRNGIWAGSSVYQPLYNLTGEPAGRYPAAASLHARIVLIPTHPYLRMRDIQRIARIAG